MIKNIKKGFAISVKDKVVGELSLFVIIASFKVFSFLEKNFFISFSLINELFSELSLIELILLIEIELLNKFHFLPIYYFI